jgi:hypothetical protein
MGPSLGVPQQPNLAPVIGTATHPVDLDHSAADPEQPTIVPEQPTVDLDQYHWLFTTAMGE